MSFTIPDVFLINYGSIDDEHRSLVEHVNGLLKITQNGSSGNFERAFEALLEEFTSHFQHEEALMADAGYDGLKWHSEHHSASIAVLKQLFADCRQKGKVETNDINFCFDHIITDIAKADLKFAEFLDATNGRKAI